MCMGRGAMATNKQKQAIKEIVENRGISTGQAMLNAGYDPTTAKNPKNLTESKAWPDLVEEYLPDEEVVKAHNRGLNATKIHTSHTEPDVVVDDIPTQLKAVDLAYKVKAKYSEQPRVTNNILVIPGELLEKYQIEGEKDVR